MTNYPTIQSQNKSQFSEYALSTATVGSILKVQTAAYQPIICNFILRTHAENVFSTKLVCWNLLLIYNQGI